MQTQLAQLRTMTSVVADTGDIQAIAQFKPQDATTNPSLIYKAALLPQYQPLVKKAVDWAKAQNSADTMALCLDKLAVDIGREILAIVPGYVSTEVDARLSFDTEATITRARRLIELYESNGLPRERILIKIAATWEGIEAARILEQENIKCNLTLLFSFSQAVACAQAKATLISPFVGRILDWYKAKQPDANFSGANDPGVRSVSEIYRYYKTYAYPTIVMGASFRNTQEIIELAGCDKLTISPQLLEELSQTDSAIEQKLNPQAKSEHAKWPELNEAQFRWHLNQDAMATEKLAEGIRNFAADLIKLEQYLSKEYL